VTLVEQPPPERTRASQPHQCWQVDACDQVRLANGQEVCWLRFVDEYTGAVLQTVVLPWPRGAEVPLPRVLDVLRKVFSRWGLPQQLRTDNGTPWGTSGGLPTEVHLWLAGLGVSLCRNRPNHPQENAKVERSQRTAQNWAVPPDCASLEQLQKRLDEEDRVQREVYPVQEQRSRWELHPELRHAPRWYVAGAEPYLWEWLLALTLLSRYVVRRRVSAAGKISLYDQPVEVGRPWAGQRVCVQLALREEYGQWRAEWVIRQEDGTELRRTPVRGLSQKEILSGTRDRPHHRAAGQT
jgi:transposase InsO family protein